MGGIDRIANLVGEDEESGTDIFNEDQGVQTNEPMQEGGGGGMVPKTSTVGDIGDTPTGGGSVQGAEQDSGDQVSAQEMMKANVGKTEAPSALGGIQQQIKTNTDALQAQADEYTQNYKDQYQFDIEDQALDDAVQGGYGSDAYSTADTMLQRRDPGAADQFEGAEDYRVKDVGYLQNDAGLGYLAGQGRGNQYTQGMSAFDVMLMKRDPNFNNFINEIRGENAALEGQLDTVPDQLEEAAYGYGEKQLEGAQTSARDYLGGYKDRKQKSNEAEADEYEAAIAALDRDAIGTEELGTVEEQIRKYFGDEYKGDRYEQQIADAIAAYDASGKIDFNDTDYDYTDFLNEGEANEFNNLGGLLGTGDTFSESIGPGEQYETDQAGMYQDLWSGINQARDTRDLEQEELIRQIMGGAEGRATTENERRSGEYDTYGDDLQAMYDEITQDYRFQPFSRDWLADYQTSPDYQSNLTGSQMLTEDEAAQLQAIQSDLGYDYDWSAGTGGGGSLLDQGDLEEYLLGRSMDSMQEQIRNNEADSSAEAARAEAELSKARDEYNALPAPQRLTYRGPYNPATDQLK